MNIQDKIDDLLAKAAPFRSMEDDDETKRPLTGIVDEINKLRALQAAGQAKIQTEEEEIDAFSEIDAFRAACKADHVLRLPKLPKLPKIPKLGRPARVEGSDAE